MNETEKLEFKLLKDTMFKLREDLICLQREKQKENEKDRLIRTIIFINDNNKPHVAQEKIRNLLEEYYENNSY